MDNDYEHSLRHYYWNNSPSIQQDSEWSDKAEKEAKEELLMYRQFVRQHVHILARDSSAILQLALNYPDSSVIYREAGKHILRSLHFSFVLFCSLSGLLVEVIQKDYPNRQFFKWENKCSNPCLLTIPLQPYRKCIAQGDKAARLSDVQLEIS